MKRRWFFVSVIGALSLLFLLLQGPEWMFAEEEDLPTIAPPGKKIPGQPPAPAIDYRISGPYTHENLSLYLFHGEDRVSGKTFLTLQEALEQKKAIVHETDTVSQLFIENLSPDAELFIQSGEIVKGGV